MVQDQCWKQGDGDAQRVFRTWSALNKMACRAEQPECGQPVSVDLVQCETFKSQFHTLTSRTVKWSTNSRNVSTQSVLGPGWKLELFYTGRTGVCLSSRAFFLIIDEHFLLTCRTLSTLHSHTHSSSSHAVWSDAPNVRLMRQYSPRNRQVKTSKRIRL